VGARRGVGGAGGAAYAGRGACMRTKNEE
jgi:hypothetical protein